MHETATQLADLQSLLDESVASAGPHLRAAFGRDRWLSARALVAALPGIFELHLAVVAGDGAPLVAPLDAVLFEGRIWVGLPAASLRARLLRRDPRVSASYTEGELALIVHGTLVEPSPEAAAAYGAHARALYIDAYGAWMADVLDAKVAASGDLTGVIEPRALFARA